MLSIIEANKEFDNKFKDVCPDCGEQLQNIVKDYNICPEEDCGNTSVFNDLGHKIN